jgi:phospho-N-acetylmuramoyl-pentapeptide-transferase
MKMGLVNLYPGGNFIITAVSNGANLTDGIDGLAAGTSAISVLALVFYICFGKTFFSNYLNIIHP